VSWSARIAFGAGAAAAGLFLLFGILDAGRLRDEERARARAALEEAAAALARTVSPGEIGSGAAQARLRGPGPARVRVVDARGLVLADSGAEIVKPPEDLSRRQEFRDALEKGTGFLAREAGGTGGEEMTAATRLAAGDGVLLLSRPHRSRPIPLRALFWKSLALFAGVAGVAAIACARLGGRLARLAEEARAAGEGRTAGHSFPRGGDEVGELGEAIDALALRLRAALSTEETDAAMLATVLEAMDEGVVAVGADERVSFLNGTARSILGIQERERVEGRALYELVRDPTILSLVRGARNHARPMSTEVTHEGGARRLIQVHAAPVASGDPLVILVVRDMSRVRQLERIRSDFVSNVGHELRTPLATISAAAENLEDAEVLRDAEAGPRFIAAIRRNVGRLQNLLDDLLTLSRLESRPDLLERVPVDLAALVRASVEDLRERSESSGVEVRVDAPASLTVTGDAGSLRRIADNLIVNAITYTPRGGRAEVSVRARNGEAVLEVADTGIGIPEADRERIFERFYRVDKARSRSAGGTGLGLAIVKHAANLHRGSVSVKSRVGEGSTFTVIIPLAPREARSDPT